VDGWALGGVGRLLSGGVDGVKGGGGLLFMSSGFHLICYNATQSVLAQ